MTLDEICDLFGNRICEDKFQLSELRRGDAYQVVRLVT